MKTCKTLLTIAICALFAVGCEDDSTGSTPATDTAAGTDVAAGTDATTAGSDTGSACPAAYEMPATDPGCTGAADKTFITGLSGDETAADDFANILRTCTLQKGCLAKTCESDKIKCISECLKKDVDDAISYQCSYCYGTYSGYCGFKKCLAVCATDTPDCAPCLAANCDIKRDACRDKGENPGLGE
jgi:hypothetical protein